MKDASRAGGESRGDGVDGFRGPAKLPREVDVLVVGAGPGGLAAGREAARRGAGTLVVDRKPTVGEPVLCGEGMLERWVSTQGLPLTGEHVANSVGHLRFVSPRGKRVDFRSRVHCAILNRDFFEQKLAALCEEAGATIAMGTALTALRLGPGGTVKGVKLRRGGPEGKYDPRAGAAQKDGRRSPVPSRDPTTHTITPKVVIAADGMDSPTGRMAGMVPQLRPAQVGSCRQYVLELEGGFDQGCMEFHFGSRNFPGGYGWLFPKSDSVANFGVMVGGSGGRLAGRHLKDFARARFAGQERPRVLRCVGACIPLSLPPEQTARGNLLLVGDAARMTNPLSGGGIANALVAGSIAGELAGGVAAKRRSPKEVVEALGGYDSLWRPRILPGLERGMTLKQKYMKDDRSIERFFRRLPAVVALMRLSPSLVERLLLSRVGL